VVPWPCRSWPPAHRRDDDIVDLVVGRRPFSDYEQIVKDWQANGGEQIRAEYQESIATSA